MKTENKIILGSLITASIIGVNCNVSMAEVQQDYVTLYKLNVRTGPSTAYRIVGTLEKNQKVTVIEKSADGHWGKIKHSSGYNWISLEYLKKVESNSGANNVVVGKTYKTTQYLNARRGPDTNYAVEVVLPKGEVVKPISIHNSGYWAKINYKGMNLYICTSYLEALSDKVENDKDEDDKNDTDYYCLENLNLRASDNTSSERLFIIPKSEKVLFLGYNSDKTWAKVKYKNSTGWVYAKYLGKKSSQESDYAYKKTSANLNLRKGTSTLYSIITTIPKDTTVKVHKQENGWAKVEYNSYIGYCSSSYLK